MRLSRLGRCRPVADARPRDIASAGVLGGPGVYGVLCFDPASVSAVGVGQSTNGLPRGATLEVVGGRERERARCFGLDRLIRNVGGRLGRDVAGDDEGGMSSSIGGVTGSS